MDACFDRSFARAMLDANADGVCLLDRTLRVTEWNPAIVQLTGVTRAEALGCHLDELLPQDALSSRSLRLQSLFVHGQPFAHEVPLPTTSRGAPHTLEIVSAPLRDDDGEVAAVMCTVRDVTHVRRDRTMLESAIEAIDAAFAIWDSEERLVAFNRRFATARPMHAGPAEAGMQLETMLAAFLVDGRHPYTGEDGAVWLARTLEQHRGPGGNHEEVMGARTMRVSISPTRDGGSVLLMTDITALKEVQASLEQARDASEVANRTKSDFLARMSHELRTPLNSIIGFARLLRRPGPPPSPQVQANYLERMEHNGVHLLGLINDLLDISRIEAGKLVVSASPVDAGVLIADTLAQLEGQPRAAGVRLHAEVPAGVYPLVTDADRLRQILVNLVGNAIKFTHAGSVRVVLECDAAQRPVAIAVCDTGIGIPADRLEAIFLPFEQGEEATVRRYGGTGLGLSISRSLCSLLGYTLEVQSREGVGTTFRVVCEAAAATRRTSSARIVTATPPPRAPVSPTDRA